jgi:hypothetical protein
MKEKIPPPSAEIILDDLMHDMTNVLQVILSGLELSRHYAEREPSKFCMDHFVNIIDKQITRGATLIHDARKSFNNLFL